MQFTASESPPKYIVINHKIYTHKKINRLCW